MASKKITAMTNWAGGQVPTDLMTGVDLSAALADQNKKTTLNDLFSTITKNITDGAVRFQEFTAPALSGAGEGALYFDDTDKTFKGSRNGGAYDDLLFGAGANQQVAVFTSSQDLVAGYAPFYYDSALERLYITDTVFSPTMEISKTGTSPAYAKIFGGQGFASLGNWSVTAAAPAYLNFYRGANGPAYPTNGMDIGSIRFRPAVDASDTPTTVGGARIDVQATENATAGVGGGVGLTIFTAANGEVTDNPRFLINYLGAVMVGVNSATITTNTGAGTRTVLGQLTTYDADAIHQIGNPTATDRKTLVIQAIAGQTKALTEWQTSAGAFLFSVGSGGSLSFGGNTGIAVSAAGQARVYFDSGLNQLRVSQNGGSYANLVNPLSPGGTTGSIQYNTGAGLIDGDNYFLWDSASATIQIGSASVLSGKILLRNSTNANTLTIQPGATGGNITFTLPTTTGSAGQFLQTDGAGVLSWAAGGGSGTLTVGTTAIASGTAGRILYETSGNVLGEIAGSGADSSGAVQFAASARTSGVAQYFRINTPADTTLTASTESVGVYFGGDGSGSTVTRQWSTGALTTQREYVFVAPTYAFAGASTLTTAATVAITGPPVAGTNATITNANALDVTGSVIFRLPAISGANGYFQISSGTATTFQTRISTTANNQYAWFTNIYYNGSSFVADTAGRSSWRLNQQVEPSDAASQISYYYAPAGSPNSIAEVFRVSGNGDSWIKGRLYVGATSATSHTAQLSVLSGSASRVGLHVDSAASPIAAIVTFTNNGTDRFTFNHDAVGYFGNGITNASPIAGTLSGTGGSGSNIAGAAINIFAGKGTGTGNPGTVSIQFARPGTTGSSLNTLSDSLLFSYTTDAIYQTYKIKTTTTAETDAAAIGVAWLDNTHATRTSVFSVQTVGNGSGLTIIAEFDLPTVAGDTGLAIYDLDNAAVERVSVGAADSGGTGFKVLRIPN